MANLPEKNITTVDKITSIPSNTNLYINANGEFRQATVDDVLKASPVIADSITNQYKNASGSPILLTDSAEGVAIDFNAKGRSTQKQYSGKNKLDCSGLSATTSNGVTFTPYYDDDGSLLYVNVNGTATAKVDFALNDLGYTTWADLGFEYDTQYTLSGCPSNGSWLSYYLYLDSTTINGSNIIKRDYGSGLTFSVSSEESEFKLKFFIRIESGTVCNNLKFYPMLRLASVTDDTYEPYVGGTASPNPSYPQPIESVGDSGYFDGELLQGYYDTSGKFVSDSNYICSKNPIPCNSADITKLIYGGLMASVCLVFYDKDMNLLSRPVSSVSVAEYETNAPTNAKYMHFLFRDSSGNITPQTAKHICVTINDKYALIVDSKGKNELENIAKTQTINGVTFTVNEDKSVTVNGTATANAELVIGSFVADVGTYILNGCPSSAVNYGIRLYDGVTHKASDTGNSVTYEVTTETTLKSSIFVGSGVTLSNAKFYPMIRPVGTDATYEPYIKSRKYIPISAPLRGIGEVTDVASLSECKVTRRFAEVVFNGTESWGDQLTNGAVYKNITDKKSGVDNLLCSHFSVGTDKQMYGVVSNGIIYIKPNVTTISEWKAWLQANPITVIYELAEPITESIEPIDVDTFEGVTHISVSDDADMEVEYPTSKVAGIASIGWSKGRRAEYDLEQLKTQMLALQTTIVSTV